MLMLLLAGAGAVYSADAPNIVLILADDVGIEPLGCYGGTSFKTPQINRLATEGMRFEHCYSMPVCHPSRIALMTGQYPFRLDNPAWGTFPQHAERDTIAQVLKRAGYRTAVAGKWQLTLLGEDLKHPHRLGFDRYCLFGWHEGPRYHDPLIWQDGQRLADTEGKYGPQLYVDFLLDFAREHKDQPFFLFYSMALCHDVTDDLDQPVPYGPDGRYMSYGEMVASMDQMVGRLVEGIDAMGIGEKTLILLTGDNGTPKSSIIRAEDGRFVREPVLVEINGQRQRGGKGELNDRGTRVPLIARWPGMITAGTQSHALVDFTDFLATCHELSGTEVLTTRPTDGISFAPVLWGLSTGDRRWAFSEHRRQRWVRTQRWKLYGDGRLVDVQSDPLTEVTVSPEMSSHAAVEARTFLAEALRQLVAGGKQNNTAANEDQ
jgi:arylsulfatase A-like enzyme